MGKENKHEKQGPDDDKKAPVNPNPNEPKPGKRGR